MKKKEYLILKNGQIMSKVNLIKTVKSATLIMRIE